MGLPSCISAASFSLLAAVASTQSRPALAGPAPRVQPVPAGSTVFRALDYVSNGHACQELDLCLPKDAKNPPSIVIIPSAAFRFGDKAGEDAAPFLKEGYAVASLEAEDPT